MARKPTTRRNKYNAKRSMGFDSQAERGYDDVLSLLKRSGQIKDYIHHPPAVKIVGSVKWRVDFKVIQNDDSGYYVEVKGMETSDYKLKLLLWKDHKPAPLFVVKKYGELRYRVIDEVGTENIEWCPLKA